MLAVMIEVKSEDYIPCSKCKEETHVNALDERLRCPTCHNGEKVNENDWRIE